jgi:hypothetical protein
MLHSVSLLLIHPGNFLDTLNLADRVAGNIRKF